MQDPCQLSEPGVPRGPCTSPGPRLAGGKPDLHGVTLAALTIISRALNGTNKRNVVKNGTEGDRLSNRLGERFCIPTEAFDADEVLAEVSAIAPSGKPKVAKATALGRGPVLCAHHRVAAVDSKSALRCATWMFVQADTSASAAGAPVYADASAAGKITLTANGGPQVGFVQSVASDGWIYLEPGAYDRTLQVMDIAIANAAVKTLNATPVEVIAAPGAGKAIEVVGDVQWMLDYDTAAFDAVGASDYLVLQYSAGSNVTASVAPAGFGDATADAGLVTPAVGVVLAANTAVDAAILTGEWYAAAGGGALAGRVKYRTVNIDLS